MTKLILIAIALLVTGPLFAEEYSCQQTRTLFTPIVEFKARGSDKKILFVGMIHQGPDAYYQRAKKRIEDWALRSQDQTLILSEFFACNVNVLQGSETSPISLAGFGEMTSKSIDEMGSLNEAQFREIVGSAYAKASCVKDVDGRFTRPSYLVARNIDGCRLAREAGIACQWESFRIQNEKIKEISGDLKLEKLSAGMQWLASTMYVSFPIWGEPTDADFENLTRLNQKLIVDVRNKELVSQTLSALSRYERVVLPWGDAHFAGVRDILVGLGYDETPLTPIKYGSSADFSSESRFSRAFERSVDLASERPELCQ